MDKNKIEEIVKTAEEEFDPTTLVMSAAKLGMAVAVGSSLKHVVKNIIQNNTDIPDTRVQKAQLFIATYAVSTVIADKAVDHIEEKLDKAINFAVGAKDWFNGKKTTVWPDAVVQSFSETEPDVPTTDDDI